MTSVVWNVSAAYDRLKAQVYSLFAAASASPTGLGAGALAAVSTVAVRHFEVGLRMDGKDLSSRCECSFEGWLWSGGDENMKDSGENRRLYIGKPFAEICAKALRLSMSLEPVQNQGSVWNGTCLRAVFGTSDSITRV